MEPEITIHVDSSEIDRAIEKASHLSELLNSINESVGVRNMTEGTKLPDIDTTLAKLRCALERSYFDKSSKTTYVMIDWETGWRVVELLSRYRSLICESA